MADLKRLAAWGVVAAGALAIGYALLARRNPPPRLLGSSLALPVLGARITSRFGPRLDPKTGEPKNHSGLDLGGLPVGTPIYSATPGKVVLIYRDGVGPGVVNGNAVHVRAPDGKLWSYLHLSRIDIPLGAAVEPGTVLGRLGSTGRSTGPHLHLQVEAPSRERLDPLALFPPGSFGDGIGAFDGKPPPQG